ncbi:MAG: hypothetical protein R3C25_02080 [Hyphomonadaceae bacterium]
MADSVWDIVGALAGAAGAGAAAIAIFQSSARAKADAEHDSATAARQELKGYKAALDALIPALNSGETLLIFSEAVARGLCQHFQVRTPDELNRAMDAVANRISLLVRWIADDPMAAAFKRERLNLQAADVQLGARLPVFSELTGLMKAIIDDSFSAVFFMNFFKPELRQMILRDLAPAATQADIENLMAREISSNAALYYAARYKRAVELIEELTDGLVNAHLALTERNLAALERKAKSAPASETRTGALRNHVQTARPFLGKIKCNEFLKLVDALEIAISKENAGAEASRIAKA